MRVFVVICLVCFQSSLEGQDLGLILESRLGVSPRTVVPHRVHHARTRHFLGFAAGLRKKRDASYFQLSLGVYSKTASRVHPHDELEIYAKYDYPLRSIIFKSGVVFSLEQTLGAFYLGDDLASFESTTIPISRDVVGAMCGLNVNVIFPVLKFWNLQAKLNLVTLGAGYQREQVHDPRLLQRDEVESGAFMELGAGAELRIGVVYLMGSKAITTFANPD